MKTSNIRRAGLSSRAIAWLLAVALVAGSVLISPISAFAIPAGEASGSMTADQFMERINIDRSSIKLTGDVTITGGTIDYRRNLTVDLNGYKLIQQSQTSEPLFRTVNANLQILNTDSEKCGEIRGSGNQAAMMINSGILNLGNRDGSASNFKITSAGSSINVNKGSQLNMYGAAEVESTDEDGVAVRVANSTMYLYGGRIKSAFDGVEVGNADVFICGGEIEAANVAVRLIGAYMELRDGAISSTSEENPAVWSKNSQVSVRQGTIDAIEAAVYACSDSTVLVSGGRLKSQTAPAMYVKSCEAVDITGGTIAGGTAGIYCNQWTDMDLEGGKISGEVAIVSGPEGSTIDICEGYNKLQVSGEESALDVYGGTTRIWGGSFDSETAGMGLYAGNTYIYGGKVQGAKNGIYVDGGYLYTSKGLFTGDMYDGCQIASGDVCLEGGVFTGGEAGLWIDGGNLTAKDASFHGTDGDGMVLSGGDSYVAGCTIEGTENGLTTDYGYISLGNGTDANKCTAQAGNELNLIGGYFYEDPSEMLPAGYIAAKVKDSDGNEMYAVGKGLTTDENGLITGGVVTGWYNSFVPEDYESQSIYKEDCDRYLTVFGKDIEVNKGSIIAGSFTFDPTEFIEAGYYVKEDKGTWTVLAKTAPSLKITTSSRTVKYAKLRKKSQTAAVKLTGVKEEAKVSYTKLSGSAKLSISESTGKITVKKGTRKGTYRIRVKAATAETQSYLAGSAVKTIRVTVK